MAYRRTALRRNYAPADKKAILQAARGIDAPKRKRSGTKRRSSKKPRARRSKKVSRAYSQSVSAGRRYQAAATASASKPRRRRKKKTSGRKSTKRSRAAKKAWQTRKRRYGKKGTKRSSRRKSRRRTSARKSKRRSSRKTSRRRSSRKSSKRSAAAKKAWRTRKRLYGKKGTKRSSRRRKSRRSSRGRKRVAHARRRSSRRRTSRRKGSRRKSRRRTSRRRTTATVGRKVYLTGVPSIDRQLSRGRIPVAVPQYRHKGRRVSVKAYPKRVRGRLSRKATVRPRRRRSKRRTSKKVASAYHAGGRGYASGMEAFMAGQMAANPRMTIYQDGRGRSFMVTPLGPKASKTSKRRSIPVLVAPHLIPRARVTKRRRKKKKSAAAMASNRRRTSMRRNPRSRRRRSRRRGSRRGTRRRSIRRRMRRNPRIFGTDVVRGVLVPVGVAGGGFLAARVAGNAVAQVDALSSRTGEIGARAIGNGLGILATLFASRQVPRLRPYQGALVTGMGIALLDNLIAQFGGEGGPLSFLGSDPYSRGLLGAYYADTSHAGAPYASMMGEYVREPVLGEYVSEDVDAAIGEYVQDGGYFEAGVNPADQRSIDGMIDVAEAQAGVGANVYEAAAGVGQTLTRDYMVSGLGASVYEAAAGLGAGPWRSPQMGRRLAQRVFQRRDLPEVNTELAPQPMKRIPQGEGSIEPIAPRAAHGYGYGIFGANLFDSMLSG